MGLARSIVDYAKGLNFELRLVENFQSLTGKGVQGKINGEDVFLGKEKFIEEIAPIDRELKEQADKLRGKAQTVVWIAYKKQVMGIFSIADPIKETTPKAIKKIHRMGLKVVMLTGDNESTAIAVAKELQIDEVRAELTPLDKQKIVSDLKNKGAVVMMAGDGINDAPALAEAEIGIAMGTGTDVAIESAGITLVKGDLHGVAKSLTLSKAVMNNIRQNLFFAFAYNVMGIPIAAGIFYPITGWFLNPMIAGAAMSLSSVSVILNSLRLKKLK